MPAAKRLPHSSKVSTCRSFGSSNASRQLRRKTRLGWFVTSRSISPGFSPDPIAHRVCHFGHLPIAAREYLGDLALGEADGALARSCLPPLALWIDRNGHFAGVLALVRAALHVEDRRLVGHTSVGLPQPRHPAPRLEAFGVPSADRKSALLRSARRQSTRSVLRPTPIGFGPASSRERTRRIRRCAGPAPTWVSCQGDAPYPRLRHRTAGRASACGGPARRRSDRVVAVAVDQTGSPA